MCLLGPGGEKSILLTEIMLSAGSSQECTEEQETDPSLESIGEIILSKPQIRGKAEATHGEGLCGGSHAPPPRFFAWLVLSMLTWTGHAQ